MSKLSADTIHHLFERINSKTVNFHENFTRHKECRHVYKHLFPQIMRLIDMHRRDPIAFHITRLYAQIRGAALQLASLNYVPQNIFVYWPRRGPSHHCEIKASRASDASIGASFALPEMSDDDEGSGKSNQLISDSLGLGKCRLNVATEEDDDDSET